MLSSGREGQYANKPYNAKNKTHCATQLWRQHHPKFIRFDTILACDGWTDRNTANKAHNIVAHCKNVRQLTLLLMLQLATSDRQLVNKHTWCFDALVMVRINAHIFLLATECKFTLWQRMQLVVISQIRPAPKTAIYHVWQSFLRVHLQTTIQRPAHHNKTPIGYEFLDKIVTHTMSCFSINIVIYWYTESNWSYYWSDLFYSSQSPHSKVTRSSATAKIARNAKNGHLRLLRSRCCGNGRGIYHFLLALNSNLTSIDHWLAFHSIHSTLLHDCIAFVCCVLLCFI